jgi:thioredoxin reductase
MNLNNGKSKMTQKAVDIAIVGAGPYGLSIAAHLSSRNAEYRLFGTPMHTWSALMPPGMLLRSEGFASNLSDAAGDHTIARYASERRVDVGGWAQPIPLDIYCDYGRWFLESLALPVEDIRLECLARTGGDFDLAFSDGTSVRARRVVLATGLTHFARMPAELAHLPADLCAHSSEPIPFEKLAGREVTVVGGGQSALETAALLHENDAIVRVIARRPELRWHPVPPPRDRALLDRARVPIGGLGMGWTSIAFERGPNVFRHLPASQRVALVGRTFGPAGAWWLRERVVGRVPMLLGRSLRTAQVERDRVRLEVDGPDGLTTELSDYVIAATGYRVDLARLPFLTPDLRDALRSVDASPRLSSKFESSVPGLHFVGASAATTFGPLMRFVAGTPFAARTVARQLLR